MVSQGGGRVVRKEVLTASQTTWAGEGMSAGCLRSQRTGAGRRIVRGEVCPRRTKAGKG